MNKRIRNKVRKNSILVLDIACIPKGWDAQKWVSIYTKLGIAIYDSYHLSPTAPFPIRMIPKGSIKTLRLIDNAKFPEIVNKLKQDI
jgi:hypothetical protein